MKLKSKGKPHWERPDLGIGKDDIRVEGSTVRVTVHSLGSVDAPKSSLVLQDASGKILASAVIPPIKAPLDYEPKTAQLTLPVPAGTSLSAYSVCIDPEGKVKEITRRNNLVKIP